MSNCLAVASGSYGGPLGPPGEGNQFLPKQMVDLRGLTARTAYWNEPLDAIWMKILTRLGSLDRLRLSQLDQWLRALALPPICSVSGANLQQRLDALLRLEAVYPLLTATARHLQAEAALAAARPVELIRADLNEAYAAKVEHERRYLSRRWAELINEAKPWAAQLETRIPLFERIAAGTADTALRREWRQRYGEGSPSSR